MSWSAASFDWNQARAFLATAEHGSLSAAARELGQTQPTLGRQVAALEEDLGVALFDRAGRGLILTDAGRELLMHVRDMAEAAARIPLTASGQSQALRGTVSIPASDIFSTLLLPPIIADLARSAPEIDIELIAANELRDLSRREADIALRHVRPTEPHLTARLLGEGLCTSAGPLATAAFRLASLGLPAPRGHHDCLQVPVRQSGLPLVDQRFLDLAHRRGLKVHVWTIDDPAEMHRLLDLGVDGLMTDRPTVLRDVLRDRGAWAD